MDGDAEYTNERSGIGALVERLGQTLGRVPLDDEDRRGRALELKLLMAGIDEHGVDSAALIRYGMTDLAWLPVTVLMIVTSEDSLITGEQSIDIDGWLNVLGLPSLPLRTSSGPPSEEAIKRAQEVVARASVTLPLWVQRAKMQDILELNPPARELLESVPTAVPSEEVTESYTWLWERYGRPEFEKWSASSLRREYRWREEDWVPPFPPDVLIVSRSDDAALHREIASRFVANPVDVGDGDLLYKLQDHAVQFLSQGRWGEAAALFEFYLHRDPDNHVARNNLGFCLLPMDPTLALVHLESLERTRVVNRTMLVHNVCTALRAVGRHAEALDKAEFHWQRGGGGDRGGAYLWRDDEGGLVLYHAADLRLALAELGAMIALELGLESRHAKWSERASNLAAPRRDVAAKSD